MIKKFYVAILLFLTVFCAAILDANAAETDKTLVSWVYGGELESDGGSVLTLQRGQEFDAIVLGEMEEGKWMAGSDFFNRTNQDQDYESETADEDELIQMAIVYKDDSVTLYRNGEELDSYSAGNIDLLEGDEQVVVFGRRHLGGEGTLEGAIEDARIYAKALSVEELKALKPDRASDIEPWAWFDFEGDVVEDRSGRFEMSMANDDAELNDGRLVLEQDAVVVAARNAEALELAQESGEPEAADPSEWEGETPTMPDEIPDNWVTYHLAHPGPGVGEPGDPNAAIYYKGKYHLHYIYRNRFGFCFAHVSSDDMVHWEWHETTLAPPTNGGYGMYSGTAFLTKEGKPAIIYHGEGRDRNVVQIAQDDTLDSWSEAIPVIPIGPDGEEAESNNWDPDGWLMDGTYYAISGGRPPEIMKNDNLDEKWTFLGKLFHEDTDWEALGVDPNEDVSCANMFKIGDQWMLLCISHELGCRYYLGGFKDEKYLPTDHHLMNWRDIDFFAPESLLTPDGRRVMWAWMTDRTSSSQTARQSLPRAISLTEDDELRVKPIRELNSLRYDETNEGTIEIKAGESHRLTKIKGNTTELSALIEPTDADMFGVRVFCDDEGNGMVVGYDAKKKKLVAGEVEAPFELKDGEALELTVYLDKDMVDVFANGRQAITTAQFGGYKHKPIELFTEGGDISATVKGWKMRSIY